VTHLDDALAGVARLALDTSPFIYFIEVHPQYEPIVSEVFRRLQTGPLAGFTSVVSLAEVLVLPIAQGDASLQWAYQRIFRRSRLLRMQPIRRTTAARAAELRARHRLRLPDAFQVAAGLEAGCQAFLTNDLALRRVTELRVLVLDELEL
jgi:predicted nucleic acid-binding protein